MLLYSIKLLDIPLSPGKPKDTSKTKSDTIPVMKQETKVEHTENDQPFTQTTWEKQGSRNMMPCHLRLRTTERYKESVGCSVPAVPSPETKNVDKQTYLTDTSNT